MPPLCGNLNFLGSGCLSISGSHPERALRDLVQGQIENGTLFLNISSAIACEVKQASQRVFEEMQIIMEKTFALIMSDIYSVLAQIEIWSGELARRKLEERQYIAQLSPKLQRLEKHYEIILGTIEQL